MAVEVRYPGRVCLLGEHNDWAGGASLVVPLPLSVRVACEEARGGLRVHAELEGELLDARFPVEGGVDRGGGPMRFVGAAAAVLHARGVALRPAFLSIDGDLPAGRGFSSSAATCLGVLDALARHAGVVLPAADLAELAYEVEHDRLGVDCGRLDPVACAAGRPLFLRWRVGPRGDPELAPRPLVAAGRFHLVAASFPRPRDTAGILRTLQEAWHGDLRDALATERARRVYTALERFGALATRGAWALAQGDAAGLGACLDEARAAYEEELHEGFAALRAPGLWQACRDLKEAGALGAKGSGAGGDGSVIALFADEADARAGQALLSARGLGAWYCPFGEDP